MNKQILSLALSAVCVAASPALLSPSAFAQAVSVNGGSIQGTITDPSGAVVANATISITGTDTGFKKELTTDKAGLYAIGPLNPGNYNITVAAPGYQTLSVSTVVRTGTSTPGSFKLTVGQASTEISVTAGAVQVNQDQISVSDVITRQQIDSLPINGRNFLDVAGIEPGVILQDGQSFDPTKAGYSAISVGGTSGRVTRILLDGQDITDETVGTTIVNVTTGAINEFQLNRATQDVSGEVTSTGQVLVSTGSGTNSFHGQLFYNFQDHRALFAKTTNGYDAPFQRNQFGGSIGGPIIKDKLFFFANSERIKQDQDASAVAGSVFASIYAQYPVIPVPFRDTFSVARLDYNGPLGGHYFARAFYEANAAGANYNFLYSIYNNRDNVPGIAGGADFSKGRFTHSFRGSYEKFHNLLGDTTAGNHSVYNPNDGISLFDSTDGLYAGPNYLAPQGTFQSDKQIRYDGTWTKGRNNFKFGYSLNRILGGGFAAFFSASPLVEFSSEQLIGNPADPLNGYMPGPVVLGNGNGAFTEKPAFGLPGGGVHDWREGAYFADTIKLGPSLTVVAGLRWSVDTDRANQDLPTMTCDSAVALGLNPGCTGSTSLLATFGSQYTGQVHQPYGNFGPQFGFVFSPADHKTSILGGVGIYYENDIFNNTGNARPGALNAPGAYFGDTAICGGAGTSIVLPGGGKLSSVTANGTTATIASVCQMSIAQAAPFLLAARTAYQSATAANAISANGSYYGANLSTVNSGAIYGAPYRTPYSIQITGGIQREVTKGGVLTVNYVHNNSFKVPLSIDVNHNGAARTLNTTAAKNAIAATAGSYTACAAATTTSAQVQCALSQGATMVDFANNGLDSGNTFLAGGYAAQAFGLTPNTGAAFGGVNAVYGTTQLILPVGQSGYDAAQVVFKDVKQHPAPGILSANFQASYSLSRVITDSGGGQDQFFNNAPFDIDNPKLYLGRNGIDHTNEVSFGGGINIKYGATIGFAGHFFSAPPSNLTIANSGDPGEIFRSDVTGDGTVGDILPGTVPGDYMHRVKPSSLNTFITNYNTTQANTPTPAGQALIAAGLFTQSQLLAAGGVKPMLATNPANIALPNSAFRDFDVNVKYPIALSRLREGVSLVPGMAMYNVANMANFTNLSGALQNTNGSNTLTGGNTYAIQNGLRVQRGAGTFDQGAPRTTEFQLTLNF